MVMVPSLTGGCEVSVELKHWGIGRWFSFTLIFRGCIKCQQLTYNPSITINNDFSWVPPENWVITSDWSEHGNKNHTHPIWSKTALTESCQFLPSNISLTSSTGAFKRCSRRSSKDSLLALRRSNCCCCRCLALRTWGAKWRFKRELGGKNGVLITLPK